MIARGAKLPDVLATLVNLIEAQSEGMLCSVLQLSEDGKYIRSGAAPSLPDIYVKAVDGAPIGPRNGSCGTAMYLGKPVIVRICCSIRYGQIIWNWRSSQACACWSTPIFFGLWQGLGSFAMYYRQPQSPTGSEARLTKSRRTSRVSPSNTSAENELRASEERFAKAFHANPHPMSLAALDDGRLIESTKVSLH